MPRTVNYISEFFPSQAHGGWDGMCAGVAAELARHLQVHYVSPIRPRVNLIEKAVSKARRILGSKGNFYYYSDRRLDACAKAVAGRCLAEADADFFHGATPWLHCHPVRPYYTYMDACFETYLALYLNPADFRSRDIARIKALEKIWLAKAARVFVSSQWCRDEIRRLYRMAGENIEVVGLGGAIPIPERDVYRGELQFLCVATDFERKGGHLVFEAFKRVRARYPQAELTFVGEVPPKGIRQHPGVAYMGYLRKAIPTEKARLTQIFSQARALLLPSTADTTPIILAEVGYYGCPAITVNRFGVAEMVNNETGVLLNAPVKVDSLAEAMLRLCSTGDLYDRLRRNARRHCIQNLTWECVVRKMLVSAGLASTDTSYNGANACSRQGAASC